VAGGALAQSRTRCGAASSRRSARRIPTAGSCIITARSIRWARCCARAQSARRCTMPPRISRQTSSSPIWTRCGRLRSSGFRETGRGPDLNDRQLHARRRVHKSLEALGGISSPAGSCVWHVVGLQRSVREWAIRQGWGGRPVRQEQAQGILVAALGMLAAHVGHARPSGPPEVGRAGADNHGRCKIKLWLADPGPTPIPSTCRRLPIF
jgi:hypothetical protein